MSRFKPLARVVAINTAFAFIPPILLLAMTAEHVSFARVRDTFLYSLVYSYCIGSLCFATVPKLWCAVDGGRAWLRWVFRIAILLIDTVLGSLLACGILILFGWLPRDFYWPEFWGSLKIAIFISIVAGLIIGLYDTFQDRLQETTLQLKTKELER